MSDSPPSAPDFTPVPVRARNDGWAPALQRAFIAALCRTRSVSAAARAVGMSRESAYRLRARPGAESFAAAWDAGVATRPPPLRANLSQLWFRAIFGKVRPIVRNGEQVGALHQPDNEALLKLHGRAQRASRHRARWAERRREHGRSQ